jgi:glycogen operon protein
MSLTELLQQSQLRWHGLNVDQPDWGRDSHSLAFTVQGKRGLFHLILNAYWDALEFELPSPSNGSRNGWRRLIDTFQESPHDFCDLADAPVVEGLTYLVRPRSVVLLLAESPTATPDP